MLSLPNDGRYPTLELAPEQRRQKTLEALTVQLEALAKGNWHGSTGSVLPRK
jgi:hypothetical protein